jgi:hypothetical protein
MMKKPLIYLVATLTWAYIFVGNGLAQTYDTLWTKAIGGIYTDIGSHIVQLSDGNYIITGHTSSYGAGVQDIYLIKTNSNGDTLWTNTFGGGGTDFGRSIVETENGDIIILGFTGSFGEDGDFYLVKTDGMGDSIWTKTFGGPDMDNGFTITRADSGFILLGSSMSFGAGENDIYLIKINNDGDTLWTKTYGGTLDDEGFSIQQSSDGGFIITGYTESFGLGLQDIYLVKTDPIGDTLWTRTFGGSNSDIGSYVYQAPDNGYIIVGYTDSYGSGGWDCYVVKTDSSGNLLWTRTFGGSGFDTARSLCETPEGEYLIAGILNFVGSDSSDVYLIKIDNSGDSLWATTLGGSGNDAAHSIWRTMDDNYIITGYTSSIGAGGLDVFLIKLVSDQSDIRDVVYKPRFNIAHNYPNPFNARTIINYSLPEETDITIAIYNLLGQKVATLFDGAQQPGEHNLTWDASAFPSGLYFARIQSGDRSENIKMVLLK